MFKKSGNVNLNTNLTIIRFKDNEKSDNDKGMWENWKKYNESSGKIRFTSSSLLDTSGVFNFLLQIALGWTDLSVFIGYMPRRELPGLKNACF